MLSKQAETYNFVYQKAFPIPTSSMHTKRGGGWHQICSKSILLTNFSYHFFLLYNIQPMIKMKRNSVHLFVAIAAPSLYILCLFFLEVEQKRERESNSDKKMHGVPFHPTKKLQQHYFREFEISDLNVSSFINFNSLTRRYLVSFNTINDQPRSIFCYNVLK